MSVGVGLVRRPDVIIRVPLRACVSRDLTPARSMDEKELARVRAPQPTSLLPSMTNLLLINGAAAVAVVVAVAAAPLFLPQCIL